MLSVTPAISGTDGGVQLPLWNNTADSSGEKIEERSKDPSHPDRKISGEIAPSMVVFSPDASANKRAAIVICPGGGYGGLAWDKEGLDIARFLRDRGFTAAALKYRLPKPAEMEGDQPLPLIDARRAVRMIRSRATELGVDPNAVGVMGFSAGGHLAACVAAYGSESDGDPLSAHISGKPHFLVLGYPVLSADPEIRHGGSFQNLLGSSPSPALLERFSLEKHAGQMPPAFIFHAKDDGVKIATSEKLAEAMRTAGIPVETHFYEVGGHGFGLARNKPAPLNGWPDLLVRWLENIAPAKKPAPESPAQ